MSDELPALLVDPPWEREARAAVAEPTGPPKLPWLHRDQLPKVWLRNGRVLPAGAVDNLIGALALGPVSNADPHGYPGLPETLEQCDRDALADFGWALFDDWVSARMPPGNGWVIDQFLWLANDDSVRQLGALLLSWPGVGTDEHAAGVLGEIGTDAALAQLHRITQWAKAPGLRSTAEECLARAATKRGLGIDELADRLVPDFGLDADGTLALDYGSRRFTVGFDENLTPFAVDEAGVNRQTLPEPGIIDDRTLAPAAYHRFNELRNQARVVAGDQIRRLELAMVTGRRWSAAEFERYLVTHPLLRHIARRLVWTTGEISFRLAEDFTPTDIDDTTITLPETARIGIAHPVELGAEASGWRGVFADYEIAQPFPQLRRPVDDPTETERDTGGID
ncbi:DUF4132 domain-containing protein [Nocardia uniformis]|uniref:DUF4132 domain-containing protein n=1 Tax=Nocardia uniformis TaxID=53432 RepID=A0A849C7L4_9NOCA|nr:DUF4132 domain-containing protein [Nocardia uniformis]NNH73766.1 DUF4132 domain-containing protein [Nocardia uniformis]